MTKFKFFLVLCMLAFMFSGNLMANAMYFEGSLRDDNGYAVVNQVGISAKAYIYSDAVNNEVYADCGTVSFNTDENGNFGVYLENVSLPVDGKAYYFGLTLTASNKEITPRMKISTAPYAVYAKEASGNVSPEINLSSSELTIGTATVNELNCQNSLNVSGALKLTSVPSYIKDLHVKDLNFSSKTPVSLLDQQASGGISTKWEDFAANAGSLVVEKSEDKTHEFTAAADGMLMVAARSDESGGEAKFYLTITSGDFTVCNDRELTTDTDEENIECVVFTFPVKKGERVQIRGRCVTSGLYWRQGMVKARIIYFGKH